MGPVGWRDVTDDQLVLCGICRYPLSNYTFSTKEAQPEEDPSVTSRLQRLQNNYEDFGMRRTVEGILVVHEHGHPHVLMLQIANAFFKLYIFVFFTTLIFGYVIYSYDLTSECLLNFDRILLKWCFLGGERPGDYLRPGEDDVEGLKERLDDRLAPPAGQFGAGTTSAQGQKDWEIGDCLSQWWRPNCLSFFSLCRRSRLLISPFNQFY